MHSREVCVVAGGDRALTTGEAAGGSCFGSDACRALLEYAFIDRGLNRVQLEVLADNDAAIRAYHAAGFVVQGRLRESAWVRGRFADEIVMSVLAPVR